MIQRDNIRALSAVVCIYALLLVLLIPTPASAEEAARPAQNVKAGSWAKVMNMGRGSKVSVVTFDQKVHDGVFYSADPETFTIVLPGYQLPSPPLFAGEEKALEKIPRSQIQSVRHDKASMRTAAGIGGLVAGGTLIVYPMTYKGGFPRVGVSLVTAGTLLLIFRGGPKLVYSAVPASEPKDK